MSDKIKIATLNVTNIATLNATDNVTNIATLNATFYATETATRIATRDAINEELENVK